MANIPIRDMAQSGTPTASSQIVFDDGTMKRGTVASMADAVRPVASQSEAEAGADNAKVMSSLRVKQSIAVELTNTVTTNGAQNLTNKTINGANNSLTVRIANDVSGLGTGVAAALAVNVGSAGAPVVNGGALGTPSSATLTNATGLPISTGISGAGTGVLTALAVNVGTAGSVVINGGALGTPSSGTATNLTGLPVATGISGLGTGVATFLATPSSANLRAALTDETGTGLAYFQGGALGTPASGTLTNATGLPISTGISGAGTGVLTALGVNIGSAGAVIINGGALGTPSSGTLTNATGLPLSGLTAQAAYTIVMNNSGSSASPTAVDVSAITAKAVPVSGDIVLIQDSAAGNSFKRTTVGAIGSAGVSGVSSIAGNTGAFTLSNGITNSGNDIRINAGHIPGEPSNGNAAAGEVGEYISSIVANGTGPSLTNGVPLSVTSISLTAGDWDLRGVGAVTGTATSLTVVQFSFSTTNNTLNTSPDRYVNNFYGGANVFAQTAIANALPAARISLSATTTVYLVVYAVFSGGTGTGWGSINARRVR